MCTSLCAVSGCTCGRARQHSSSGGGGDGAAAAAAAFPAAAGWPRGWQLAQTCLLVAGGSCGGRRAALGGGRGADGGDNPVGQPRQTAQDTTDV